MDSKIKQVCNAYKGGCFYCHNPNNFQKEIYPKLLELKKEGKQVLWVGGDLGKRTSEFEYKNEAGIVFLGNGLWYKNNNNNKVLLFSKQKNKALKYRFVHLDTLINKKKIILKYKLFVWKSSRVLTI